MSATNVAVVNRVLARRALEDYARRRAEDWSTTRLLQELPPLVDRAKAAGLSIEEISALAQGRRA